MASRTHREMAMAVAFAEVFSKQLKAYYLAEKPRAKKIHPILDAVISVSEKHLEFFRDKLTAKDVMIDIANKVDAFNSMTTNSMSQKEAAAFIIGVLAERICKLVENKSRSGNIERLEEVQKAMESLYEYFENVTNEDVEEESTELFRAWEAA